MPHYMKEKDMEKINDFEESIYYQSYIIDNNKYEVLIPCRPKVDYCIINLLDMYDNTIKNTYQVSLVENKYIPLRDDEVEEYIKDIDIIMNSACVGYIPVGDADGVLYTPKTYSKLWDFLIYFVNKETRSEIHNISIPNYGNIERDK